MILVKSKAPFGQHCNWAAREHLNGASSDLHMYKHIVIATDGSDAAGRAVAAQLGVSCQAQNVVTLSPVSVLVRR